MRRPDPTVGSRTRPIPAGPPLPSPSPPSESKGLASTSDTSSTWTGWKPLSTPAPAATGLDRRVLARLRTDVPRRDGKPGAEARAPGLVLVGLGPGDRVRLKRGERGRNPSLPLALGMGPDALIHVPRVVGEPCRDVHEGEVSGGPSLTLPRVRLDRGLRVVPLAGGAAGFPEGAARAERRRGHGSPSARGPAGWQASRGLGSAPRRGCGCIFGSSTDA